ncbi:MAG: HD domain-containing protein [Spirochaetales bacterium]|nr:HD domain-containing protein [Spirochaetales bacterium]
MELEEKLIRRGERKLSPSRWSHSLRTAEYALFLADHYSLECPVLRCAALAHDLAREQKSEKVLKKALKDQGDLPVFILQNPVLQHGFAAAWILRKKYGVTDLSLLNAVRYHTTGHPCLDETGLLLFAADYMEAGREHLDDAERSRLLGLSLKDMVLEILSAMEKHILEKGLEPSPDSRELSHYLSTGYNSPA